MTIVNVHQAKTQLSRLLAQVEAGEEVMIARRGEPVVRLVACKSRSKRQPDVLKGKIVVPEDFFEPLPEEEFFEGLGRRVALRILLDTHALLWWLAHSGRLSRACLRSDCRREQRRLRERRIGLGNCDQATARQVAGHGGDDRYRPWNRGSGIRGSSDRGSRCRTGRAAAWPSPRPLRPNADCPGADARFDDRVDRYGVRPIRRQAAVVKRTFYRNSASPFMSL